MRTPHRRGRLGQFGVLTLLVSLLVSACASPRAPRAGAGNDVGAPIDWNHPLIGGTKVSSVAAASPQLSFVPAVPGDASGPQSVYISDPNDPSLQPKERVLGLVFDDPKLGTFWVLEHLSDLTTADLAATAANCTPTAGCEANDSMTQLNDGVPALTVGTSSVTNGVIWLNGGIYVDVEGPAPAFSMSDALSVANSVEQSASSSK